MASSLSVVDLPKNQALAVEAYMFLGMQEQESEEAVNRSEVKWQCI